VDDIFILIAILCVVALVAVFINKRLLTLLLSSAFMLLVAIRLNVPSMYLMGTVLLALPLASWAVGWYGARRINVELTAPEAAFEGEDIPVSIDVDCPLPAFSMLARPLCELPKWISAVEGSEKREAIPNGVRQQFTVRAARRGVFDLSLGVIAVNDPLGIFSISRRARQSRVLLVYPRGLSLPTLTAKDGLTAGWLLDAASGRRGEDDGFFGTREYRSGDDIRRIHWRSSARLGSLVVAERENWVRSTVWICVDTYPPRNRRGDVELAQEQAVKAAVSIMEAMLLQGHLVGLSAAGTEETHIIPAGGSDQRWRILEALARLRMDGGTPLSEMALRLDAVAGSTAVFVTTEPTAELAEAAARLRDAAVTTALAVVEAGTPLNASKSYDEAVESVSAAGADVLVVPMPAAVGAASSPVAGA
jgi:uncharacterized protein (DUF58 family)